MRVGVIGAGGIGRTVGRLLHEAGHEMMASWASSEARLGEAADAIGSGTQTGTPAQAVAYEELPTAQRGSRNDVRGFVGLRTFLCGSGRPSRASISKYARTYSS
jgi:homoserine dehydrogenase